MAAVHRLDARPRADRIAADSGPGAYREASSRKDLRLAGSDARLKGDPIAGKAVFTSAGCVGCHTLKDAGATGTVGPNLDDAKPDTELVVTRVTKGMGAMPPFAGQLTDQQIADVAAYVTQATGG